MKKKFLIVLGALILLTGCGKVPKLQDGKEVVASIDGYDLTAEELYEKLKEAGGLNIIINQIDEKIVEKEIGESKDAEKYADNQIEALKLQAELQKIDFNDEFIQNYYGLKNESELKKAIEQGYKKNEVLQNHLAKKLTEEEINEYYNKEIYGEMTVKHILIAPDVKEDATDEQKKEAEAKALEKAKDLIKQIKDGADFDTLAKENSDDANTANQGGLLAKFNKQSGFATEFFDASLNLKNGEYTTTPVKTIHGYHIILKVDQNEKPKLEDVIDDIKETLVENKLAEDNTLSVTAWDEIRNEHKLSINEDSIKKEYEDIINSYKK